MLVNERFWFFPLKKCLSASVAAPNLGPGPNHRAISLMYFAEHPADADTYCNSMRNKHKHVLTFMLIHAYACIFMHNHAYSCFLPHSRCHPFMSMPIYGSDLISLLTSAIKKPKLSLFNPSMGRILLNWTRTDFVKLLSFCVQTIF